MRKTEAHEGKDLRVTKVRTVAEPGIIKPELAHRQHTAFSTASLSSLLMNFHMNHRVLSQAQSQCSEEGLMWTLSDDYLSTQTFAHRMSTPSHCHFSANPLPMVATELLSSKVLSEKNLH